ncbi:uncharacterized protein LOC119732895 [Patiria miniata]|uniref:Uncharacterized protein n=1 Tax=Patiria miniata TaxID=46514 RepID=A0A913Z5B7_PATMI|nr:uncharacterized protein LOC119721091 [Patiria miniata]XP_038062411.1 uncharacterized protein LOC119732895 [Patiria miniata]
MKTARFYPGLDIVLLREALALSSEDGQGLSKEAWEVIHKNINDAIKAKHIYVTLRACRDRYRHLQDCHRRAEMSSLRASGTDEEYDERIQLLTELADFDEERKLAQIKRKSEEAEKERQGVIIREVAMKSLSATKTRNDDVTDPELTPPQRKRRNTASDSYVKYLEDKLEFEREKFELEKKEREARLEKDNEMMKLMMTLIKK